MKFASVLFFLFSISVFAQYNFEPSSEFPFGQPNPEAPEQIKDYQPMIGLCDCKSISRKQDGTWAEAVDMTWEWNYILNGMAIRDETLKSDGTHSGSIRQFSADSSRWYVHYYTSRRIVTSLPVWEGNKNNEGNIVLYRDQKAPNGTEGDYRLTFFNISEKGFDWVGEWVDKAETIVYPTWKISCLKRKE